MGQLFKWVTDIEAKIIVLPVLLWYPVHLEYSIKEARKNIDDKDSARPTTPVT